MFCVKEDPSDVVIDNDAVAVALPVTHPEAAKLVRSLVYSLASAE